MTIDQTAGLGVFRVELTSISVDREPDQPGLSWQREMERAQMSNWFQPPVLHTAEARVAAQPGQVIVDQDMPAVMPTVAVLRASSAHWPAPTQAPYGMPSSVLVAHGASLPAQQMTLGANFMSRLNTAVTSAAIKELNLANLTAHTSRSGYQTEVAFKPPGINVHVEPHAHGVAVWIGVPVNDPFPEARLAALLQTLKNSLKQEGKALQALTVNGRSIWSASTQHENTPEES